MNRLISSPSNRRAHLTVIGICLVINVVNFETAMAVGATLASTVEKTTWHGFDRYDFVMNTETLAITPFKAPDGEGDGGRDDRRDLDERRTVAAVERLSRSYGRAGLVCDVLDENAQRHRGDRYGR